MRHRPQRCMCQKQPLTKMTFRKRGNTRLGKSDLLTGQAATARIRRTSTAHFLEITMTAAKVTDPFSLCAISALRAKIVEPFAGVGLALTAARTRLFDHRGFRDAGPPFLSGRDMSRPGTRKSPVGGAWAVITSRSFFGNLMPRNSKYAVTTRSMSKVEKSKSGPLANRNKTCRRANGNSAIVI